MTKKGVLSLTKIVALALLAVVTTGCKKEVMVAGGFSVGGGRQVKFAKGNVYYNVLTKTFAMYENQWDFTGGYNDSIDKPNYHGYIDLFGWGTANNPMLYTEKDEDYATFEDWGTKLGGNWRTLTKDEWKYIMKKRPDAKKKYAFAEVGHARGIILLPDIWTLPDSCVFFPGMDYIDSNQFDARMWKKMENAGAVFLPSTGYREGPTYKSTWFEGRYWTSTGDFVNGAWGFGFDALRKIGVMCYAHRYPGFAVRLVEDVK